MNNLINKIINSQISKRTRKISGIIGFVLVTVIIGTVCLKGRNEDIMISTNKESVADSKDTKNSVGKDDQNAVEDIRGIDADTKGDTLQDLKTDTKADTQNDIPVSVEEETIIVYVCGAVNNPGVVEIKSKSRVYEAVQKAGGMTAEADSVYVNLAGELTDGVKIYIPTLEETKDASKKDALETFENKVSKSDGLINLNTATKEELLLLPGVGDSKADSIIRYREEHGNFNSIEEIMNITGIKEGLFNKIKDKVTV